MNNWKESDWFKNWLAIARQGQNAMRRAEGQGELPPALADRQSVAPAEATEVAPAAEWQTAE
ncbi:MAG TPA: hypothetical protein VFB72_08935 [Verrucomicrobiae bacterium]|nr:hypothetical protein [Verrucomicrobiae bacterium]